MALPEEYNTGFDQIDTQHDKIIEMINQLNVNKISLENSVNKLLNYVEIHLKYEEHLMEKSKYPELLLHRKEHSYFVSTIIDFGKQLNNKELTNTYVAKFLNDWFMNHILKSDKKLGIFLSRKN